MTFLRLNGITIPVAAKSMQHELQDIGSRGRAFDGTYLVDRRATKRKWRGRTTPQNELAAHAIAGLIRNEGHYWKFDYLSQSAGTFDLYSSMGLAYGSTVGSLRPLKSATNSRVVYDVFNAAETKFGTGALELSSAVTNILTDNVANGTEAAATTGWTAVAAGTISSSTTEALIGSRSLKIVCTASGDGANAIMTTATTTTYYLSVYVMHDRGSAATLQARLWPTSGTGVTSSDSVSAASGIWYKFNGQISSGTTTEYNLEITSQTAAVFNVYVDCALVSTNGRSVTTTHTPPWTTGTRANGTLAYSAKPWRRAYDLTAMFWARTMETDAVTKYVGALRDTATSGNEVTWSRTSGTLSLVCPQRLTTVSMGTVSTAWAHYAAVIRCNYEDGESYNVLTYKNGAVVTNVTTNGSNHDPTAWTSLELGHYNSGSHWEGAIDGFALLPYAMPASMISATYTSQATDGVEWAQHQLLMDGDITPRSTYITAVRGNVLGINYLPARAGSDGAWHTNKYVVEFELEEV